MLYICLSMLETDEEKCRFEDIYLKYKNKMYSIAHSILNNKEDAEDSVQQAFFAIANNFDKLKKIPRDKLEAYIVVVIRNIAFDIYRKNKKSAEHLAELDERQSVSIDFFENMDYNRLIEAISTLPQKYKDVLFMRYIEDFSIKKIAEMFDISKDNVYKRLERAKKLLKAELEKEQKYGE